MIECHKDTNVSAPTHAMKNMIRNYDLLETFTLDGSGNLVKKQIDNDCDGSVNHLCVYTYDSNGNASLIMFYAHDENRQQDRGRN